MYSDDLSEHDRQYVSNWRTTARPTRPVPNAPTPQKWVQSSLQNDKPPSNFSCTEWLRVPPEEALTALCNLRDHMFKDSMQIARVLELEQL
jgi:hypothetical protein